MGPKKITAIILLVLALGVLGYWVGSGGHIFTQTQVQVDVEDELFGTTTKEWRDEFRPGLDYAGPVAAVLLLAAGWLFRSAAKDRQRLVATH